MFTRSIGGGEFFGSSKTFHYSSENLISNSWQENSSVTNIVYKRQYAMDELLNIDTDTLGFLEILYL